MKPIELTIHAAAIEFGCSRETITRGLRQQGVPAKPGEKYTLKQIHRAVAGDLKQERARVERARADRMERENELEARTTIKMADVEAFTVHRFIVPIGNILAAAPAQLGPQCNPTDPLFASGVIAEWVENTFKPQLKAGIEALEEKKGTNHR